ncbi:MAG: ferritin [Flavobacteriales bacterium]
MIHNKIEEALNNQVKSEAASSQLYLAMASWCEGQGMEGSADFFYSHSDEERMHMLKLFKYINERGGQALVPALEQPRLEFDSLSQVCEILLQHEIQVSESINHLVFLCLENKDYTTHNFLQWFVSEQIEEEALARSILDKLKLIGEDKGGLYLFDRDIAQYTVTSAAQNEEV